MAGRYEDTLKIIKLLYQFNIKNKINNLVKNNNKDSSGKEINNGIEDRNIKDLYIYDKINKNY